MAKPIGRQAWDRYLEGHPDAHLLQTSSWGALKSAFGWEARRLLHGPAGAQLLLRRLPFGLRLAYIPKGPVGDWLPDLLPDLDQLCKEEGAFALKIEPDAEWGEAAADALRRYGFQPSPHAIQPGRTINVSLAQDEEAILARMKQKTRYNIRLAARKGVQVHASDDLHTFASLMNHTATRDAFAAHSAAYYRKAYDLFHPSGMCELLAAEVEGKVVAALMIFARGRRAWYFYGASSDRHREKMPTYLLQWEAMRWAKARRCQTYDLWGIPDADEEDLERQFAARSDGLWGVYRFKRGFGGQVVRTLGAWDRIYSPARYALYRAGLRLRQGRGA